MENVAIKEGNYKIIEENNKEFRKRFEKCFIKDEQRRQLKRFIDNEEKYFYEEKTKEFLENIYKIVSTILENKQFLVPKKNTKHSQLYEQVEYTIFYGYMWDLVGHQGKKEFIKFLEIVNVIKVASHGSIVSTASNNGKKLRTVCLSKEFVNMVRKQVA